MLPEDEPLPAPSNSQAHAGGKWEDNINLNKESQLTHLYKLV